MSTESLYEIIKNTSKEVFEVSTEVAEKFAQVLATRVTGFFLRFENIPSCLLMKGIEFDGTRFIVTWESISTRAQCPECGYISEKEHSAYLYSEMIQDVGINGKALWHKIYRKKYICVNDHCLKKRFMEGFPGFVESKQARMTTNFADYVLRTSINTSSRATVQILQAEGIEIAKDTVLRITLRRGAKEVESNFYDKAGEVVYTGIDDINLRKGDNSTSCMVVVNLDTGKLLGIIRGTTGDTAKHVLEQFPNLKIVSRDRGTAMASAAEELELISVADRFHITDNVHDVIERTLHETLPKSTYIPIGNAWVCICNDDENDEIVVSNIPASLIEKDIEKRIRIAHLSGKSELTYRNTLRVLELTLQGKHAEEISDILEIPIENVRKLRSGMRDTISDVEKRIDAYIVDPKGSVKKQKSVSNSAHPSSKSIVEPYHDVVESLMKEGKGHRTIHEEICKLGFTGSHSTVDNYMIKLKREDSIEAEIKAERIATNTFFVTPIERPERISVCIYSVKTIYKRVLAIIGKSRNSTTGDDNPLESKSQSKKKLYTFKEQNELTS